MVARRAPRRPRPPAPARRPQLFSFVARCLRSWEAARASATEFLATWTPLGLPDALSSNRLEHARRGPAVRSVRSGQRPARHAFPFASAVAWQIPIAIAGSPEALRARYPLVNALLLEMGLQRRQVAARTRQRG